MRGVVRLLSGANTQIINTAGEKKAQFIISADKKAVRFRFCPGIIQFSCFSHFASHFRYDPGQLFIALILTKAFQSEKRAFFGECLAPLRISMIFKANAYFPDSPRIFNENLKFRFCPDVFILFVVPAVVVIIPACLMQQILVSVGTAAVIIAFYETVQTFRKRTANNLDRLACRQWLLNKMRRFGRCGCLCVSAASQEDRHDQAYNQRLFSHGAIL